MKTKTKTQPALVGIIPRRGLWDLICKEGWYHIPIKSAPKNILLIEYIAFYFPDCFDEKDRFQIKYYAKVLKIDKVKRINLFPNEKKHKNAKKDYYQIHLGKIKKLPHPIPSNKWRRITHIPTSKQKLFEASEINDLWDTSPLEEKMYREMKKEKIEVERQFYIEAGGEKYFLDFGIFCRGGKIDVECDGEKYHVMPEALIRDRKRNNKLASAGWRVLRFSGKEINYDIRNCIVIIKGTIYNLGGIPKNNKNPKMGF